ncbi:alpha/beta hydrolase family protein [Micromonospora echinospora]
MQGFVMRGSRIVISTALTGLLLAGLSVPAHATTASMPEAVTAVDPGRPGPYDVDEAEYDVPAVNLPGFAAPVAMRGVVVAPVAARGARPLILFLHGLHHPCYDAATRVEIAAWPCPDSARVLPNHRGYLAMQRLLASQGYLTVSIDANAISAQEEQSSRDHGAQARSTLVRHHLSRWADWAGAGRADAPAAVREAPRADLTRVLLVGHSRGGEGVNRAALDSLRPPPAGDDGYPGVARWTVRGTVLIAPTLYGHNPVPDVPSMTILPSCDGDVVDQHGQIYADGNRGVTPRTALHSVVYMVGANHNYFNSEWTPGQAQAAGWDDAARHPRLGNDPHCGVESPDRLTADQQQSAGKAYVAGAARLFIHGDDRVRPLLDGSGVRAPSAGPVRIHTHALGGARAPLIVPNNRLTIDGSGARLCQQVDPDPATTCLADDEGRSPHFAPFGKRSPHPQHKPEPDRHAVALTWSAPGEAVSMRPPRPVSVTGAEALAMRIIVPPGSAAETVMDVAVTDTSGRHARLGSVRLTGLPGTRVTASYWAQEVRVPLTVARSTGVDLRSIAALALTPRSGPGSAWLMDVWGWRPGAGPSTPAPLLRVDIGHETVDEGDAGIRTHRIPITVTGHSGGHGQVRLFLTDPTTKKTTERLVTLDSADPYVTVAVDVEGNTHPDGHRRHVLTARAVSGVVVGNYIGGLDVRDDDPAPHGGA